MSLTKAEIITQIMELGLDRKESARLLETLLEIMKQSLENGDDVMVSGFGKLSVKQKSPRRGRNPATGDDLMLDARKVVTFKPSGILRKRINEGL